MFKQAYQTICEFNRGAYGVAYKVRHRKEHIEYIAKSVSLGSFTETQRKKALLELDIMKELKHPHIVSYKESFLEEDELIIVLEFCELGDLSQHIRQRRQSGEHFSENLILNWLLQLVMALKYIHDKKILHRDIKAANVFLTAGCVIKLGDFGISKILSETVHSKTFVGTPYYMSPEMCQNLPYTNKSDIWSLGCVLYEIALLEYPFKGKNLLLLLQNITSSDPERELPPCYSSDLKAMVKKLLTKDHRKRPSANDILFDPLMVELVRGAMQKSTGNLRKEFDIKIPPQPKQVQLSKLSHALIEEQERLVAEKLRVVQRLTSERLALLKHGDDSHSLTLYEAQIQRNIEELQKAVKEGFMRLRGEPDTRSTTLRSSGLSATTKSEVVGNDDIAGETVRSVIMGTTAKKASEVPIDNDKTIYSVELNEGNNEMDRTIQSMLFDTLGQMQGSLRLGAASSGTKVLEHSATESSLGEELPVQSTLSESSPGNNSRQFRGNRLMRTIQQLHDKAEEPLKQSEQSEAEQLQLHIGQIKVLSEEVRLNPQSLLDNSVLDFSLSTSLRPGHTLKLQNTLKEQTFELSLTNRTEGTLRKPPLVQRTTSPLEQPLTKSIQLPSNRSFEDEYLTEQFEEYEEEDLPKGPSASKAGSSPNEQKMQKERQEIADIYRSMLQQMEKPQRNKYLVMSGTCAVIVEIKEVSDESALNTGSNFRASSGSGMVSTIGKKKS